MILSHMITKSSTIFFKYLFISKGLVIGFQNIVFFANTIFYWSFTLTSTKAFVPLLIWIRFSTIKFALIITWNMFRYFIFFFWFIYSCYHYFFIYLFLLFRFTFSVLFGAHILLHKLSRVLQLPLYLFKLIINK